MGLFDKKYCDVCGEKIGLLGNRKLEDGNLCKDCAAKLSPWFSDRKQSTVEEIKEQLAYREANKDAVAAFHATRTFGTGTKIMLDEDNMKFLVTSASNLANANPDVLNFSDVTGCNLEIDESSSEITTKDADGKSVSYNPPRYEYDYDFYMTIDVSNKYFNRMRFRLNNSTLTIGPEVISSVNTVTTTAPAAGMNRTMGAQAGMRPSQPAMQQRPGMPQAGMQRTAGGNLHAAPQQPARTMGAQPGMRPGQPGQRPGMPAAGMQRTAGGNLHAAPQQPARPQAPARPMASAAPQTHTVQQGSETVRKVDPTTNAQYMEYLNMGEEIRAALLQIRMDAREAAAPKTAVVCPFCGATTIPDANGRCEYCGGAVME